jgi:hypothetical protein
MEKNKLWGSSLLTFNTIGTINFKLRVTFLLMALYYTIRLPIKRIKVLKN